jgi:hypothetical protein
MVLDDMNDIIEDLNNVGEFTTNNLAVLLNEDNDMQCWFYVNDIIVLLNYMIFIAFGRKALIIL